MSERRRRAEEVRGLADWFFNNGYPAEEAILRAAADLLDPPFTGPTLRARIAVAVTRGGELCAARDSRDDDDEAMRSAMDGAWRDGDDLAPPQIRWVEADVPAWEAPKVVKGEVVS